MVGVLQAKKPSNTAGPHYQGPTSTFATRDFVAKVDVGPR